MNKNDKNVVVDEVVENEVVTGDVVDTNESESITPVSAVALAGDVASVNFIEMLNNPKSNFYCSIKDDGKRATKTKIYNALKSSDNNLADHIGDTLDIVDVVAHEVKLVDDVTGEVLNCLRTVLVDVNGVGYACVSEVVMKDLLAIYCIVGEPSWIDEPLKIKVRQKAGKGVNKFLSIELI